MSKNFYAGGLDGLYSFMSQYQQTLRKINKGHEWQAIIGNRHKGNGCPIRRKNKKERSK